MFLILFALFTCLTHAVDKKSVKLGPYWRLDIYHQEDNIKFYLAPDTEIPCEADNPAAMCNPVLANLRFSVTPLSLSRGQTLRLLLRPEITKEPKIGSSFDLSTVPSFLIQSNKNTNFSASKISSDEESEDEFRSTKEGYSALTDELHHLNIGGPAEENPLRAFTSQVLEGITIGLSGTDISNLSRIRVPASIKPNHQAPVFPDSLKGMQFTLTNSRAEYSERILTGNLPDNEDLIETGTLHKLDKRQVEYLLRNEQVWYLRLPTKFAHHSLELLSSLELRKQFWWWLNNDSKKDDDDDKKEPDGAASSGSMWYSLSRMKSSSASSTSSDNHQSVSSDGNGNTEPGQKDALKACDSGIGQRSMLSGGDKKTIGADTKNIYAPFVGGLALIGLIYNGGSQADSFAMKAPSTPAYLHSPISAH